jgi:hypothetical protein
MGRREMRAELQASWSTFTPRVPGTPFRRKDLEDADERASLGEPSHPGTPPLALRSAARPGGTTLPVALTDAIPLTLISWSQR